MTEEQLRKSLDLIRGMERDRLTLRDQFAMAALTGFMGSGDCATGNHDATAKLAYRFADAMLEARKEKK